ncbi:MAG: homogentisate 1,2-dioxygenase [Pseudomonadota bacterium]
MNSPREYLSGFGNHHSTSALDDVLPVGQNSPQRVARGLYAEKFSSTAFTAPRDKNARSWFYRIRPSAVQGEFEPINQHRLLSGPATASQPTTPNQLRWDPLPLPNDPTDFIDGLVTVAVNGDVRAQVGVGIHQYAANRSMDGRYFYSADGELLIVPQLGALTVRTECGVLEVEPGDIVVIPRGIKFAVDLQGGDARGYVLENYGEIMSLPERGPIGSDGLANERDFLYPVACFEDKDGDFELIAKLGGHLFRAPLPHSPLDVVAWHGNTAPYKYDLRRFNTIGSISFDHPDPSIFTVLTSQSSDAGVANVDFVVFPPRWLVMEHTFRPPWYHRNVMSEYMGLIYGDYDAKTGGGFVPGGASLHNCMSPHGPDADTFDNASAADLVPTKLDETMAFMFESRYLIEPTDFAMNSPTLQRGYAACWQGLKKRFEG